VNPQPAVLPPLLVLFIDLGDQVAFVSLLGIAVKEMLRLE
jgi:hypothetical protein